MPAKKSKKIPPATWRQIRIFAMDVDGILTDGTLQIASGATTIRASSANRRD